MTRESGIDFVHDPAVGGKYLIPESIGAGGALFDYDGDGDLDIYLVNGRANRLYRQDAGTFRDVTAVSGLGDGGYGMGVAVGDVDGDGDSDVYVTNYGPDALYVNRGDGTFVEATRAAGVDNPAWGASAAFFDMEGDGDLDLYVTNYLAFDPAAVCTDPAGRRDYCGPAGADGVADVLYRNDGHGRFTDVSRAAGVARVGKGLGVVAADLDGDALVDVYVANDGEPNFLWINQGDGTFVNRAVEMGAAVNALGQAEAGMGVALGDADGDGVLDVLVTHLRGETHTFYRGDATLGFVDATLASGLGGTSRPYTGFGTGFFDADHDGDLDLAVVHGRVTRGPDLSGSPSYWGPYAEPDFFYRNDGRGRFAVEPAGDLTARVENSRGLAFGDVDDDGDVDLLATGGGGPVRLLRNDMARGSWLVVGVPDVGAVVTVTAGGREQLRVVAPGSSFLSSGDPRVHFGLGDADAIDELRIRRPDGEAWRVRGLPANRRLVVGGRR
ncbi:MAG TPA: CRTAC1 family protein [Thermoanaerobaculia bacterium]